MLKKLTTISLFLMLSSGMAHAAVGMSEMNQPAANMVALEATVTPTGVTGFDRQRPNGTDVAFTKVPAGFVLIITDIYAEANGVDTLTLAIQPPATRQNPSPAPVPFTAGQVSTTVFSLPVPRTGYVIGQNCSITVTEDAPANLTGLKIYGYLVSVK